MKEETISNTYTNSSNLPLHIIGRPIRFTVPSCNGYYQVAKTELLTKNANCERAGKYEDLATRKIGE